MDIGAVLYMYETALTMTRILRFNVDVHFGQTAPVRNAGNFVRISPSPLAMLSESLDTGWRMLWLI